MKRLVSVIVIATIGSGLSGFAAAQVKPEDTIKNRKSSLTLVQTHMRSISAMLKGERPMDAAFVAKNAALIETLAKAFPDGFPRAAASATPRPGRKSGRSPTGSGR